jgi:stearoyl-CoA desaturase (Delta-9 desaturase)
MSMRPRISGSTPQARAYVLRRQGGLPQRLHAGAILAVPTAAAAVATWQVIHDGVRLWQPALAVLSYALVMIGITVGFHRLLSHRAFHAPPVVQWVLVILGSMAMQGPPVYWVSNHRRHHQFADVAGDPHSPHHANGRSLEGWRGFWHAHVGWTFSHELTNSAFFCKDLLRDPAIMRINRGYYGWVAAGLLIPVAIGGLLSGGPSGMWNGLLWGAGIRLFISYHLTSSINSITHLFGYRSFPTAEHSRNNLWLGLPTLGEAWHNNHHAFPGSAIFGLSWWEIDIGAAVIRLLEMVGLAHNVRRPSAEMIARRRAPLTPAEAGHCHLNDRCA